MLNYNLTTNHFLNSENYLNNLIALLGPTNTGKTYYAIERMLQYNSGIIGFPLRLLARDKLDVKQLLNEDFALSSKFMSEYGYDIDNFY